MPREIVILSRRQHDLHAVADAAEGIVGAVEVREIDGGQALQVITAEKADLVTLYAPRRIDTAGEVERLLPHAPAISLPVWWTDGLAPLGEEGEAGVSIALRLALRMDAVCLVDD